VTEGKISRRILDFSCDNQNGQMAEIRNIHLPCVVTEGITKGHNC